MRLTINIIDFWLAHYSDGIMSGMASQITGVSIVCSTVCSGADKKKTPKLRVTGLCEGNSPVTGGFPSQKTSNTENISTRWRHHGLQLPTIYHKIDSAGYKWNFAKLSTFYFNFNLNNKSLTLTPTSFLNGNLLVIPVTTKILWCF